MTNADWANKDFYKVLGIAKDASAADIKKAYRKLARENHPDSHPGNKAAEERFKAIAEAYDVVGDPEKRKEYDDLRAGVGAGFGPFTTDGGGRPFALNDVFGNGGARTAGAAPPSAPTARSATGVRAPRGAAGSGISSAACSVEAAARVPAPP